jgi:hypothetical protein
MGVLYVISDRQSASTAFELASRERDDVSILLMGEACGLLDDRETRISLEKTGKFYCLGDMENASSLVEVVDYSGWVKLIEENERIVSWT